VANEPGGTILRIDPKTTRVTTRIRPGGRPFSLAADYNGNIWVAVS
jgi:DNA-binding beta-propeller fold protein YncE